MVSNPHFYGQSTTGTPNQIEDGVDFPHTGIIKALADGLGQNYAISGFDITFDDATQIDVGTGVIFRDGKRHEISAGNNLALGRTTASENSYHLVVVDKDNDIAIRSPSAKDKVADYTVRTLTSGTTTAHKQGDTIVAVVTHNGSNPAPVQYLTVDKAENSLSIGYSNSGTYAEGLTIDTDAGDTTIENKVSDKDIIFKVNDGGTPTEVMRIDGSTSRIGIGETAPDSMLHLKSASATSPTIKIENTGTDASEAEIIFQRTGTAAQSQDIGHIKFKALDDGGATHLYASLFADAQDETAGTEDGRLLFTVAKGGTDNVEILRLSGSEGFVFNDASNDLNFRIESNGNANILFVDGGNDNVGIGTNTNDANAILTVEGAISLDEISAPSNTADRGQLYTNADNHLHFINGAGTDVKVTEEVFIVALSDETTDLTTGTGKASFHMPFAMTLTGVKANCTTAPAGATIIVDINEAGSTILSTKLSIDASETTSATAASAAVISDTALADDALITFDIDQVGSSTAGKGLKVTLYGYRA
tara:strand:- start:671 stop:2275 length:1605 start_codon:yes stop_codon:yes gene_type:complete